MSPFTINGRSYLLNRFVQTLPATDLIAWLESQILYPKVFWKEQDSPIVRAAVGSLLQFSQIPQFSGAAPFDVRLYGGIQFCKNHQKDKTWQGFPKRCFWLPKIEISQEEKQAQIVSYSVGTPATAESLEIPAFPRREEFPSLIKQTHSPGKESWQSNVDSVLHSIASGGLDKLVLARKTSLEFTSSLSPWPILSRLCNRAQAATLFAFQLSPHLCFLGATPEKLFQREGDLFNTDAVAATRPRGKTSEEDLQLEIDLLTSGKEQREFRFVKDYLHSALIPLSEEMKWEEADRVIKGSHVQHLYNRLKATLKHSISDSDLIHTLHPTPSLGGYPRKEALDLLREMEPFDRGWYGAPLGVIGNQKTSLYVAIRSALIQERSMHLFAGTGLVPGSTAEREWEELEQKIRPFMELFF